MKKIVFYINQGFTLRFFCHTNIIKKIQEKNVQITIVSHNSESVKNNININNINYITIDELKLKNFRLKNFFYSFLELIRNHTLGGNYKTPKVLLNYCKKDYGLLKFYTIKIITFLLNKNFFLRKIFLFLQKLYISPEVLKILKEIKPHMLVTGSLGTFDYDQHFIKAAKKLNIKTTTCILSWDNTTTRGYPACVPDYVLSWTETMKEELIKGSDIDKKKIFVSGVPHFDDYYLNNFEDKKVFFNNLGLNQDKNLIVFFTKSPNTFLYNPNIIDLVCSNIKKNKINNCQLLVRIHPLYYKTDENNNNYYGEGLEIFKFYENKYDDLIINYPEITSNNINFEMSRNEQFYLKNLLKHSDLVLNIFSTVNIEASIFNKPIINIDFDNFQQLYKFDILKQRFSLDIDRNLNHNMRIINTGGVRNVKNETELVSAINHYLKNPVSDENKRKVIFENEAGPYKNNSSKYVAEKIFSFF